MPHVDDTGLPRTPPRRQAPLPKQPPEPSSAKDAEPSLEERKIGLLPILSVMDYKPDDKLVREALGIKDWDGQNGLRGQL